MLRPSPAAPAAHRPIGLLSRWCALAVALLFLWPALVLAGELEVHILDVGQGSGIFVLGPDGTRVAVDAGPPGAGNSAVLPYLSSRGITGLDWSVMTHWHTDHYGGLTELFNAGWLPTFSAWDRGNFNIPSNPLVSAYLAAAAGKRATPSVGQKIQLGDGAFLEVVAINGITAQGVVPVVGTAQEENSRSIAVLISYGDFQFYYGGDLTSGGNGTANVEGPMSQSVGQVEAVLTSHHGSNTSSSQFVVSNLAPSFVAHSNGLGNNFGHPTKTTTNRWNAPGAVRVQWGTSEGDQSNGSGGWTSAEGHMVLRTDGQRFRVEAVTSGESVGFTTFENPGILASPANLRVSELLTRPANAANDVGQWIELVNISQGPVDLGGVRILSGAQNFTIASRILLEPMEYLVVGLDGKPSRNGDLFVHLGAPWESFALPTTSGSVEVRAANGTTIETVQWGPGAVPAQLGISSERVDLSQPPSAANFAPAPTPWAPGADRGTPGRVNDNDLSTFPPTLSLNSSQVGGLLSFGLSAPGKNGQVYGLLASATIGFGLNLYGLQTPHPPDPFLLYWVQFVPNIIGILATPPSATFQLAIPPNPSLVGFVGFASFLTLDLVPGGLVGTGQSNTLIFVLQ